MFVRRLILQLKSTAPYICQIPSCESKICRNYSKWKQTLNPAITSHNTRLATTHFVRSYAKTMDKPKSQGKLNSRQCVPCFQTSFNCMLFNHDSGKKKLELREDILGEYFNVDKIKMEMNDVVEYMREQFLENISVRTAVGTSSIFSGKIARNNVF